MKDGRPSFPAGCVPFKLWENSPFTVSLDGRTAGSGGFPALVESLRRKRVGFIRLSGSFTLRAPSLPFRPAATRFPGPCRRIPSLRLGGYFIPEHQIGSGIFHGRMRAGKGATFLSPEAILPYNSNPAWYTSVAVRKPSSVRPANWASANHQVPASRLATVTVPMQGRAMRQNIMMLMPCSGV